MTTGKDLITKWQQSDEGKKFIAAMDAQYKAALQNNSGGGTSRVGSANARQESGVKPTDLFEIPSMQGRLSGEQLQQYNATVESILNATFSSGVRNKNGLLDSFEDLVAYQQDAINEAASNFETLNDPNASELDRQKARMSIDQLGTSDMGDIKNPNSPLAGYREKGTSYFNEDVRYENYSPEDLAQFLDDPEMLNAEDYTVSDKLKAQGEAYRNAREGIKYEDTPTRQTASVNDIAAREVGQNELVSPEIADKILSQWGNQDFLDNLDMTGEGAIKNSLGYFDELIANEGRDAVSDAYLNRAQRESEMRRKAYVDAQLEQLANRGMSGSGSELQAYLQGAGQSMGEQFDAAMEAAAMAQQRKDAAAEQRAVQGQALQMLSDGRAATMAEAIDLATRERAGMQRDIASENAGRYSDAANQNFAWQGERAAKNAELANTAYGDQFGAQQEEAFARNRGKEGVEQQIYGTNVGGTMSDRQARMATDVANRDIAEQAKRAAAGQSNTATEIGQKQQELDARYGNQDLGFWDYLAAGHELGGDVVKGIFSYGASTQGEEEEKK